MATIVSAAVSTTHEPSYRHFSMGNARLDGYDKHTSEVQVPKSIA